MSAADAVQFESVYYEIFNDQHTKMAGRYFISEFTWLKSVRYAISNDQHTKTEVELFLHARVFSLRSS